MKSRETSIRLQRFEVSKRRQKLADLEMMIADFKRMAHDLEHQIKVEQETSGIRDVKHFAYPTFAKAAAQRRDNLLASIAELQKKLAEAGAEVEAALDELRKMEMAEERETGRSEDAAPEPLTPTFQGSAGSQPPPQPVSGGRTVGAGGRPETVRLPGETDRPDAPPHPVPPHGGGLRVIGRGA